MDPCFKQTWILLRHFRYVHWRNLLRIPWSNFWRNLKTSLEVSLINTLNNYWTNPLGHSSRNRRRNFRWNSGEIFESFCDGTNEKSLEDDPVVYKREFLRIILKDIPEGLCRTDTSEKKKRWKNSWKNIWRNCRRRVSFGFPSGFVSENPPRFPF